MSHEPEPWKAIDTVSLRDYFASHAPAYPFKPPMIDPHLDDDPAAKVGNAIAAWNYAYADAMLQERDK